MQQDLLIGYRGASGGFLLLHLLLLSQQYHVSFPHNETVQDVVEHQWNISNPAQWKNHEIWPSNLDTANYKTFKPKIFFLCGPTVEEYSQGQAHNVLHCYNNIKDPAWPEINSLEQYHGLPDYIRQECEELHQLDRVINWHHGMINAKKIWLYTDIHAQNELAFYKKAYLYQGKPLAPKKSLEGELFENCLIDRHGVECAVLSDCSIYLQDLVKNPNLLVQAGLISEINQSQLNLLKKWKSLHPSQLLIDIGIMP